ncbi:RHS repeat-associated core domain-containing protein [Pseudomonas putida]|nr:RHS repeat-associated core domain-containing protein [Pseudomonas putida]
MKNYKHLANYSSSHLLTIDRSGSALNLLVKPFSYSCFDYLPADHGLSVLLAFNAQPLELSTGCYLLGNGRRVYSPMLMRFQSPDALSPFEAGGLNAYGYCEGDPVNWQDESGQVRSRSLSPVGSVSSTSSNSSTNSGQEALGTTVPLSPAKRKKSVQFSQTTTTTTYEVILIDPNIPLYEKKLKDSQEKLTKNNNQYNANPTRENKIKIGKELQKAQIMSSKLQAAKKHSPTVFTYPNLDQLEIRKTKD